MHIRSEGAERSETAPGPELSAVTALLPLSVEADYEPVLGLALLERLAKLGELGRKLG